MSKSARARRPIEPDPNVNIALIYPEQIPQNRIALSVVQANYLLCHRAVHEKALSARDGMHANERVDALDVFGPGIWVVAVKIGVRGAVDGVTPADDPPELWRQLLVGGIA